jgi:hypothetical protein
MTVEITTKNGMKITQTIDTQSIVMALQQAIINIEKNPMFSNIRTTAVKVEIIP